jgi:tRNA(Ile)-lysidine synthase
MKKQIIHTINHYIDEHISLPAEQSIVVAFSGGPDSVALLDILCTLAQEKCWKIYAAHMDHGWRDSSSAEALLCKEWCKKYSIECIVEHLDTYLQNNPLLQKACSKNSSKEAYARIARYDFLLNYAASIAENCVIATAHHRDDQEETFFLRLIRGASLQGLCGIRPTSIYKNATLIRPLLCCNKKELLQHAQDNNLAYSRDPSNNDCAYLRNRIRHTIIPAFEQTDERFHTTFHKTLANLSSIDDYIQQQTVQAFEQISYINTDNQRTIDIQKLLALHQYLQQQVILYWLYSEQVLFTPSQTLLAEIIRFLQRHTTHAHTTSHTLYGAWRISCKKKHAIVEKIKTTPSN